MGKPSPYFPYPQNKETENQDAVILPSGVVSDTVELLYRNTKLRTGVGMKRLEAIQQLLDSERKKQEEDLRDLNIIRGMLEGLEKKIDEGFAGLNPKSQYRLLGIHDVMDLIGLGDKWITDRVSENSFPAPKLIGGKRKWYQKDIESWIVNMMKED